MNIFPQKKLVALLCSRIILFAFFQTLIAVILTSWNESERYWMVVATLGNIVSIVLLVVLYKSERTNFRDLFAFDRSHWKKDLPLFFGFNSANRPNCNGTKLFA